ncbi:MAG: prepilin-type N-terminal cleavage/methylation domain-containing protein [Campylobacterota bacterium]|nr:prepilin-type N-terminal cleavage/methylation domain-containing protein [Campylobacterota bacterium]
MRKGFTLIELLVSLVLSMIFLNFAFSFYANFLVESRYIVAKEKLAIEAFRLSEILTRGFMQDSSTYVSGVISLKSLTDVSSYVANDSDKVVDINDSAGFTKINGYTHEHLYTDDSFHLKAIGSEGLYSFEMNTTTKNMQQNSPIGDAQYLPYQRLVYTK